VEGHHSIFKRGMKRIYQHCGEKHLHRYLAEFDFRSTPAAHGNQTWPISGGSNSLPSRAQVLHLARGLHDIAHPAAFMDLANPIESTIDLTRISLRAEKVSWGKLLNWFWRREQRHPIMEFRT
jgi:hypothetical protein